MGAKQERWTEKIFNKKSLIRYVNNKRIYLLRFIRFRDSPLWAENKENIFLFLRKFHKLNFLLFIDFFYAEHITLVDDIQYLFNENEKFIDIVFWFLIFYSQEVEHFLVGSIWFFLYSGDLKAPRGFDIALISHI